MRKIYGNRVMHKKDGSALIVAVVIMLVLMMLGLALMLVSFSLSSTASRQQNLSQSRELAQTLSRQITEELTSPDAGGSELYKYLKENISIAANRSASPSKWPYYKAGVNYHEKENAYRYFKLNSGDLTGEVSDDNRKAQALLDGTSIAMYWETSNTDAAGNDAEDGVILTVLVTCKDNKEETTITTSYQLNAVVNVDGSCTWTWMEE